MNPKRERFVEEYLIDLNATQAAIRAGYSEKTAHSIGQRLLNFVEVSQAIAERRKVEAEAHGITQARVLEELAILAFSDVDHYQFDDAGHLSVKESAPKGAGRAISSIKHRIRMDDKGNTIVDAEFKLWDKPGPLKLAGQHVGLFSDKPELDLSSLSDEEYELLKRVLTRKLALQ